LGKVSAWLRLQSSAQAAGEFTDWVDVLNSNPGVINAARRPAVGAAANSLPVAVFATNDAVAWPLATGNSDRDNRGYAFWFNFTSSAGTQVLLATNQGTNGASVRQQTVFSTGGRNINFDNYISGADGRQGASAGNVLAAAGTWCWVRLHYKSSGATEADRALLYVDGALKTLTFSAIGAGGTLGTLPAATGNTIIGNFNDGAASNPINASMGPNLFVLNADLTAAEELALMNFERPT
jgi:hypothetical protein